MKEVYAGKSTIAGRGLFVRERVKKGEPITYIRGTMQYKVNKSERDALSNPDWVGIGRNQWIDPAVPFKYLNHSCDPNIGIKGKVMMHALRPIKAHEELTIDYATIEGDERWQLDGGVPCNCGATNCRKEVRSIQFLAEHIFNRYLPYIPHYFQRVYRRNRTA